MGCGAPASQQIVNTVPLEGQTKSEILSSSIPLIVFQANKSNSQLTKKVSRKSSQINQKQSKSKLQNIRSSTKSMKNEGKNQAKTESKSAIQSFQRKMSLSPSKIKLNLGQAQKVNEQQAQVINASQKKKRKVKRKKTEADSKINELIKIYAL